MLEQIANLPGEDYDVDGYLAQFAKDTQGIDLLWKLERQQTFREPDVPSWVAFESGDIEKSLLLAEEMRPSIEAATRAKPYATKRIRVVEEPLSPYLWWEMHLLKMRADAGDEMVVVSKSDVAAMERAGALPEIVGLGTDVAWIVRYSSAGLLIGATRIVDSAAIVSCRNEFLTLHADAEDIRLFFKRVVVSMGAPTAA